LCKTLCLLVRACLLSPQGYKPKYYYFEIVGLLYKLLIACVGQLFMPDTVAQVCAERWA
jgi:hypothetical protein